MEATKESKIVSNNFKVLIIGGGNCGLAIATGLKKADIDYAVFERDRENDYYNRPRDWGMLLHWGTEYLEKVLPAHLRARISDIRCDPHGDPSACSAPVPFLNALTGQLIAEFPLEGTNRVSRMKLRRFLTQGENLNVQFERCFENVVVEGDAVRVLFRDGTQETGNLVIGCDGSHSKVREFLTGYDAAQLEPVGLTMMNFPKSGYTAEEAHLLQTLHPVFKIASHPERPGNAMLAVLDIPDPDDATTWKFQNYIGWWGPPYAEDLQDPDTRMDFYRTWTASLCEPFRTGALKLAEREVVPVYAGQQWAPTMAWDNHDGRVTLAGDAAHSMVPQRGQGLNHAMRDASDLVDAIQGIVSRKNTLAHLITAYEGEMRPRGATEVALSLEQAIKARDKSTIMDSPLFKMGWRRGHT